MQTEHRACASRVVTASTGPPSTLLALSEGWRAFLEASMLIPSMPFLRNMPHGDGHPVYLMPGFMADNNSTAMLHRWLGNLGYYTIPWGFGRNRGPRGNLMERLVTTVGDIAREHERPVSLLGQSLGGVFAREIAKVIPEQIRQVITLGSPFRLTDAHAIAPAVMRLFEIETNEKADTLEPRMHDISRPAPVPSTAIYSRTDGIANWKACIEEETPYTDNVEIYGSHCGMGFNPAVYYVVADRLAQPANAWCKFERSGTRCFMYPDAVYAAPSSNLNRRVRALKT